MTFYHQFFNKSLLREYEEDSLIYNYWVKMSKGKVIMSTGHHQVFEIAIITPSFTALRETAGFLFLIAAVCLFI